MERAGITRRRHIRAAYGAPDRAFLAQADLVVLAGGDVARGWSVLAGTGMSRTLVERHAAGALLVGISAGAVQLGLGGWAAERPRGDEAWIATLGLVPLVVDVHDEAARWSRLRRAVASSHSRGRGIAIPAGGALVYHPDHTLEPLAGQPHEVRRQAGATLLSRPLPPATVRRGAGGTDREDGPGAAGTADAGGTP